MTSDNRRAGEDAAKYTTARLKGQENVIINGLPVTAVQDRISDAMAVFTQYPGIRILSQDQDGGGSHDGGFRVMTDLLNAHPKIDAVFAENDPTGIVADLAARQAGRKDFSSSAYKVGNSTTVTLSGGTFASGGNSEGTYSTGGTGLGALTLTATSTLDFGSGSASILHFSGLGTHPTGTLAITNWDGVPDTGGGTEALLFDGSASDFTSMFGQSDVSFNGTNGYAAIQLKSSSQ